ncbi:DUF3108 domain-containing protein [Methylocella sp.]|uniref:DUF3108 domain-containing protein n=1 Tax=Methylocella sp. TaxID=1978226 RepID=UPI003783F5BB
MTLRLPALALLALLPAAARAQEATQLSYAIYAAGLNVLVVDSKAEFGPRDYRIDLAYRTTGLYGTFIPVRIDSFAQGSWNGARPAPQRFASWGVARGKERRITLDYPGGQPVIRTLVPATEPDRDPVPPAQQRDTMDTLSAMAFLVRQVAQTGRCDGTVRIFDGRRVLETQSVTAGSESLSEDYRSAFKGTALRCDMRGRQLAGFQHDADEAEIRRVHVSHAWLAPLVPGQPALPVRVSFETRFFGSATAYLTQFGPTQAVR